MKSKIEDLQYNNDLMKCKVKDNVIDNSKIKNLCFIKERVHFEIESETFNVLFEELGLKDIVKLLKIISKSKNNLHYF